SNSVYVFSGCMKKIAEKHPNEPVPLHLRNAPTGLMKDLDYGKDYKYPHDYPGGFVSQQYMPDKLQGNRFLKMSGNGLEKKFKDKYSYIKQKIGKSEDSNR
ncbi:MAG: replication-associated recombination protein A, partial [Candidatus Muiribacteriaceae bacterium]